MPRPSEDDLIARHFAPLAGPGGLGLRDDAALVALPPGCELVLTKDMLVAGVHFFPDDPPEAIARKVLRVNLSDLAAKAAEPTGILLGLGLPQDWSEPWLAGFVAALAEDCRTYGCSLLGGDTVQVPGPLTLSITALGTVPFGRMVSRPGARASDHVFLSGTIGDAALGLMVRRGGLSDLDACHREALLDRYLRPQPRMALRSALRAHARAAMDVSDGLVGDLAKMLRLQGLGARLALADLPFSPAARAALVLDPTLAVAAVTGGDDYEVLCAVPPEAAEAFGAAASRAGVPVRDIGVARRGDGVTLTDADGNRIALASGSFQHFT